MVIIIVLKRRVLRIFAVSLVAFLFLQAFYYVTRNYLLHADPGESISFKLLVWELIPGNQRYDSDQASTLPNANQEEMLENNSSQAWTPIADRFALAFSAFFDDRMKLPVVRVLVTKKVSESRDFFCQLIYSNSTKLHNSSISKAGIVKVNSYLQHRTVYDAYFLLCSIADGSAQNTRLIAVKVFASSNPSDDEISRTNAVSISYPYRPSEGAHVSTDTIYKHHLTICANRLYGWSDWLQLALFIEYYLLQGATKLIFYHRSVSASVEQVLQKYAKLDIVEIVPFPKVPAHNGEDSGSMDSWDQNQIVQLNDCVYRQIGRSEFVAVIDNDEFILPGQRNVTLVNLLKIAAAESGYAQLSFRNRFVYGYWHSKLPPFSISDKSQLSANDTISSSIAHKFSTFFLRSVYANGFVCHHNYYHKSIVRPGSVLRYEIHAMVEGTGNFVDTKYFSLEEALKYHFRPLDVDRIFNENAEETHGRARSPCVGPKYSMIAQNYLRDFYELLLNRTVSRLSQ